MTKPSDDEIIKCNKCGQVLISGRGAIAIFSIGTSIECIKCGNKYVFGQTNILTDQSKE